MSKTRLEKILFWLVRLGAYALPFCLLMVIGSLLFPFVTGKNLLFRGMVEIMAAAWAGLLIVDFKKYWPKWNLVSAAFFIFVGSAFLAAVFGADFKISFWSNFERMEGVITYLHLLALFFVLAGTFKIRREWLVIFSFSILASLLAAGYGLLEYAGVILTIAGASGGRVMSTLGNPLYVAAYLTFNIFLIIFLWLNFRSAAFRWILGVFGFLELTVFFLTGSRGAFIGLAAAFSVIAFFLFFRARTAKKRIFLGTLAVFLLLTPLLFSLLKDYPFVKNHPIFSRLASISLKEQTVQARLTIWQMAFKSFKERPILGWGSGNFIIPYAKHYDVRMYGNEAWFDRTHSAPFEWLVSGGLIGFLAYFFLFGSIGRALFKMAKSGLLRKTEAVVFIAMFVAYLAQMLFVFDTLPTYLMLVLLLAFFQAGSSASGREEWLRQSNFFVLPPTGPNEFYGPEERAEKEEAEFKKDSLVRLPMFRLASIMILFIIAFILLDAVNLKPLKAAGALVDAFGTLNQQQFKAAEEYFQKALNLSKNTIGTEEVREYLATNAIEAANYQPQFFQNQEFKSFYLFALEEMKKQVADNSDKNLKIKHNILLAQLYSAKGFSERDMELIIKSLEQYHAAIKFAPNYFHLYPLMINVLARTTAIGEAIDAISQAEALLSGAGLYDANIFYIKPRLYVIAGDYGAAYETLKGLSLSQGGPEHRLDPEKIGEIIKTAYSLGKKPEIIPFFEKVYLLDKRIMALALLLAQLQAEAGNIASAKFYANEALKQDASIRPQVEEFLKALDIISAGQPKK